MEQKLVEIVHFCREKAKELRATDPNDIPMRTRMAHFAHIQDRSGETYVQVGMDARLRIQEWCFEYLKRRGWTHLISVSHCAERIEEAIAFRFFKTCRPVDTGTISKMVNGLDKSIQNDVRPHRYLWPCHICYGDSPSEFLIGTVRFRPTINCRDEIDTAIASWGSELDKSFRTRIEEHYSSFGWIADVTVETSDKAAAKRMSLLAVQIALTAIKLLLSHGGTESRIRMSEQQNYLLERAELHFIRDEPHLTWHQTAGQAPFAKSWWEDLNRGDNAERLRALDRVVRAVIQPTEQTFLKLKYLNALRWFNDASIDTHAASRITKFVTVLETLTGCNERDDLAEAVGERVAYFLGGWPEEGMPEEVKAKVKRIYAVRSELVHGVRDPIDLELGRIATSVAHLAHMTLVAFLDLLIFIGIDRNDYDHAKLRRDFAVIKNNDQRMRAAGAVCRPPTNGGFRLS
ncbi:HEPN domain-containing protein [Sphingomonas cavernae]|uniref:Uncharacterized protein n=1 Tax=Sphingomonas cavernae TaxID=2320861 RepID=A0A418WPN1_9SPHN|nr:HEPN domain-containing protein [Sphingomonas cavernae]RJF93191.1 hypothetical protein D3876_02185 [Sphingomonas cavernae]